MRAEREGGIVERSNDGILTTHGGRLPFPGVMDEFVKARVDGDTERSTELMREGIAEMVRKQVECGIDVMSDGEFHRNPFTDYGHYSSRFSGIEQRLPAPGEQLWFGERAPEILDPRFKRFFAFIDEAGMFPDSGGMKIEFTHRLVISGPLAYRGRETIDAELQAARAALEAAGLAVEDAFYPQLAPSWLCHFLWNEYYSTEEEYVYAIAEAWRGEYQAIVNAGFILQLDDPALADKYYMFNPPISVEEYRKHMELRIEATNHAVRGIPEDRIRYHTCWGSWHYPHTRDIALEHIIDLMLKVNAQAYSIEASNVRHQLDYRVWEDVKLPDGKILIPGVVGHATSNLVEAPELVADRLVRYARIVGRENVIAGTDCGLGGRCHDDVAWAKLETLGRGAALASKELWGP
jgi:5-methyltetrahydropteroyltriglutamate--homocysteine methyltransferase